MFSRPDRPDLLLRFHLLLRHLPLDEEADPVEATQAAQRALKRSQNDWRRGLVGQATVSFVSTFLTAYTNSW